MISPLSTTCSRCRQLVAVGRPHLRRGQPCGPPARPLAPAPSLERRDYYAARDERRKAERAAARVVRIAEREARRRALIDPVLPASTARLAKVLGLHIDAARKVLWDLGYVRASRRADWTRPEARQAAK